MKTYLLALLSLIPFAAAASDNDAVKKDLTAFQGRWQVQWIERDGLKVDLETRLNATGQPFATYTIRGNKWLAGDVELNAFELDPACNPKIIDFIPNKETRIEGIYKLDGNTMIWCWYAKEGVRQRPDEFRAPKDSGRIVYAFTRIK